MRPSSTLRTVATSLAVSALSAGSLSFAETSVQVDGLVDVVGRGQDADLYLNRTFVQTTTFDALRARVFLQGGSDRTRAFVQVLFSDVGYSAVNFHGGYLQHRVFEARELYLEAGKIPVHIGTWAPRTYSNRNPLVGIPLAYHYKSTLHSKMMPRDFEDLLSRRGQGQIGVKYTNPDGSVRGATGSSLPMLYDNCWDYGAFVLGSGHSFDYAFGATLGTPGAPVNGPDPNGSVTGIAKVGVAPIAGLALHVSFAHGAYLTSDVTPYLPAGSQLEDYAQTMLVGSAEWGWRKLTLNSELFFNRFETPLVDDPLGSWSSYLEAAYRFLPGWYAAARFDTMRFEEVASASGVVTWDENIDRIEAGVGYHATRELLVKAVAQLNALDAGWDTDRILPAVQISFAF